MTGVPVLLEHDSSLAHDPGPHPEQPARIEAIRRELHAGAASGWERQQSPAVERDVLAAVHPLEYIRSIERFCAEGGGHLDPDTAASRGSYEAAVHAAGGAVRLVELLLNRAVPTGFSLHRPPGHHAEPARAMGFCLFNSVAVAARYAISRGGLERVMVFDWDVHHGNGINDIFHSSREVLYVSIHQMPLYPGTGPATDVGSGEGVGYTVNLPVGPGSDDAVFVSLTQHVVLALLEEFAPQLVLVSAGYDAHHEDPLGGCAVTEAGYAAMTSSLLAGCVEAGAALGFVLEGGYALGALGRSVAATLQAISSTQPVELVEVSPAVAQARERVSRWWPGLAV